MSWPPYIQEMDDESRYPRMQLGVWGSLGLTAILVTLIALGQRFQVVAGGWLFYGVASVMVLLDAGALVALRLRRGVLGWMFITVVGDLLLISAAVYLTGGALSPLFALYVVHLVVTAVLANAGVTLLVGAVAFALYVAMALGVYLGALPAHPPPVWRPAEITLPYLLLLFLFAGCAIGIPAVGAARLLDQLRKKTVALEARHQELQEESRRRNQFMATLTHELRNPIHGICGLTDLLTQQIYGELSAKQAGAVRQIRGSADGLLQLIEDHLQMAKDEAGRLEVHLSDVELGTLVPSAAQSIHWMVQAKHIELDTEIEPGLPTLRTDGGKLNQVLVNLLTNAVKYTPDGGRITVLVRRQDQERVSISVRDTGQGIAPQELDRIFDAFHQVGGESPGGVGLGLSLVKRLLHLLGGEIQVGSQLGHGTSFVISLPVRGEARRETSDARRRVVQVGPEKDRRADRDQARQRSR